MKVGALIIAGVCGICLGDVYMHNPRGSNNRNCRDDANAQNRKNALRLFDSQNNDKGGYSCPRAFPFNCYTLVDENERNICNSQNTGLTDAQAKAQAKSDGNVLHPFAAITPKMYYYVGSILPIEWTSQHAGGTNNKVHSDIIISVGCEEFNSDISSGAFSFTDDCGQGGSAKCQPRDGTPISNQDNDENTKTIEDSADAQDDYRRGRHESFRYYRRCSRIERNKGLFVADQKLKGSDARFTRQQPTTDDRYGFECPEESHYWPWWNPSPWIDVAVITSDISRCQSKAAASQNVQDKYYCECPQCSANPIPIQERGCQERGGTWSKVASWKSTIDSVNEPECVLGDFSRDNHLGNIAGNGQPYFYNWTIPAYLNGKSNCVVRVRYNISTGDADDVSVMGDSTLNGDTFSPILDRDENPDGVYFPIDSLCTRKDSCKAGLAIQTDQWGRTFQDRSYTFQVKTPPGNPVCDKIYNLNVRGKRGNIVQTFPAVEYDFVPNALNVTTGDCIHYQWVGSDYNPNRNPNDAEGGPPHPVEVDQSRSDRSNLVQLSQERDNRPGLHTTMFAADIEVYKRLAFLDQDVENGDSCQSFATLKANNPKDRNARDRDPRNCMKLNGQRNPYFDAGLLKPGLPNTYYYFSPRNNNFSNRGQKGVLIVRERDAGPLSAGAIFGISLAVLAGLAILIFGVKMCYDRRKEANRKIPAFLSSRTGSISSPVRTTDDNESECTALAIYDHLASDAGEISFKKGQEIEVVNMDPSGWWEGRVKNSNNIGVFPANYVVLKIAREPLNIA